jgi:hypothetical protein
MRTWESTPKATAMLEAASHLHAYLAIHVSGQKKDTFPDDSAGVTSRPALPT